MHISDATDEKVGLVSADEELAYDAVSASLQMKGPTSTQKAVVSQKGSGGNSVFNVRFTGVAHIPVVVFVGFVMLDGSNKHLRPSPWVPQIPIIDSHGHHAAAQRWPDQAFHAAHWGRKLACVMDVTLVEVRCVLLLT
jgi:hypothetical protein